jgi:hypothetical protein
MTWRQLLRPWRVLFKYGLRAYINGWVMYGWCKGFETGRKVR